MMETEMMAKRKSFIKEGGICHTILINDFK